MSHACRREFLAFLAASPLLRAQAKGLPPVTDLVNVLEIEDAARRKLAPGVFAEIAGGHEQTIRRNREYFDWITLRPRVLVDVRKLNLATTLFGKPHDFPLLVAPMRGQDAIHTDGESAMLAGAAAAKMAPVLTKPPAPGSNPWCMLVSSADDARRAADGGAQAVFVTAGNPKEPWSWTRFDEIRAAAKIPLVVKGVMSPAEATTAASRGAGAIVVSNHGGRYYDDAVSPMETLAAVVDAVQIPVFADSGFRRGTDVMKALGLGAKAVLIGRPALFGLGAYGQAGVQAALELIQSELAMAMGLSGRPTLATIDRTVVKVHRGPM